MRIGIVGGGVVGRATARAFLEHVDQVRVYDVKRELSTHSYVDTLNCDIVFVCLPTPRGPAFTLDTSIVESFLREASQFVADGRSPNLVLRSTVPIGFTKLMQQKYMLSIVHSPEFLTARCSLVDAQIPSRNIVGTTDGTWNKCREMLGSLYIARFPAVPVYHMTSDESEAVKLFQNGFFAVKVAYWNEVRALADKLGLNWQTVMDGVLSDGRISPSHTQVPGPDGKRGFGGTCLPKDSACLAGTMEQVGLMYDVIRAALTRNMVDRHGTGN